MSFTGERFLRTTNVRAGCVDFGVAVLLEVVEAFVVVV